MAKRKQEPGRILGHDPFEDLDWRELEQVPLEILGHDPFEDMESMGEREEAPFRLDQEIAEPIAGAAEVAVLEQAAAQVEPPPLVVPGEPLPSALPTEVAPAVGEIPMPRATFHFPSDFKWGVAVAAHQVEGNNVHNDWWAWEQQEGRIKKGHTSRLACDWWESAEADFDRAAQMGLDTLRLSVEWSRVEPRPGVFDDSALERYAHMLQGLRERKIEPMVTLHHFSNPRWLAEQGGWEAPETIELFARFVHRVVEALGPYCDLWCTINEPNVYGYMGYLEGVFPPGQRDLGAAMRVIRNLLVGHAAAYRAIHALQPQARVGLAHNMRILDPANSRSLLDRWAARLWDRAYNRAILTALTRGRWMLPLGFGLAWKLRRTLDWIGLNYCTRDLVAFDFSQRQTLFGRRLHADGAELLDGAYGEFYPQGIFRSLQRLARLGLPIYVTENGIPDGDDDQRPRYLLTHLNQIWHAIQLCYPVMGYYHWTLVDNFEWAEGWTLRFGLIALDPQTQVRTPRRSAALYADIVRANAISAQVVDTYAPELRAELLPG
jgi:beta-glucosidase